jgi:hypothetical protein
MAFEEIILITPLKRRVKVRMKNLGDDIWDTSLSYANQVRRVGKYKGKDFAIDAATKKAIEVADSSPSTGSIICGDDDPTCKTPTTATQKRSPSKNIKKNPS